MNATELLNSVKIPAHGLHIGQGIERGRKRERRGGVRGDQILFVQALWRYDLSQCSDPGELDRFIEMYCPGVDPDDTVTLDKVFLLRTPSEYCTFFGI